MCGAWQANLLNKLMQMRAEASLIKSGMLIKALLLFPLAGDKIKLAQSVLLIKKRSRGLNIKDNLA